MWKDALRKVGHPPVPLPERSDTETAVAEARRAEADAKLAELRARLVDLELQVVQRDQPTQDGERP